MTGLFSPARLWHHTASLQPVRALAVLLSVVLLASESHAVEDGFLDNAYFAVYATASLPRLTGVENKSTGRLANLGVVTEEVTDGVIFAPSLIMGYNFKKMGLPLRLEGEYTIRSKTEYRQSPALDGTAGRNTVMEGVVENQTVMANMLFDIDVGWDRWTPFIGAGIGVAWNNGEAYRLSPNGTAFGEQRLNTISTELAFAGIAGISMSFGTDWHFDSRYRYMDMGTVQWGPSTLNPTDEIQLDAGFTAHEFSMGLRYQF